MTPRYWADQFRARGCAQFCPCCQGSTFHLNRQWPRPLSQIIGGSATGGQVAITSL